MRDETILPQGRLGRLHLSFCLSLCGLALALATSPPARAQNPIHDGQIYYFTGPATINANLIDVDPTSNLELGNDIVLGRAPGGDYGADGDIDILTPYTVTLSGGARTAANALNDGYAGISLYNASRLVVDNTFDSINGGYAPDIHLFDNSQIEVNGATNIDVNNPFYYNINSLYAAGGSHILVNGNTINALGGEGTGQSTITGGFVNTGLFTGSSSLVMTGGILNTFAVQDNAQVTISGGTLLGFCFGLNTSQITVSGGTLGNLEVGSTLVVTGGSFNDVRMRDTGQMTMSGGTGYRIQGLANSQTTFSAGTLTNGLYLSGNATATVSGGSIGTLYQGKDGETGDGSHAIINGGSIDFLFLEWNSVADLNAGTVQNAQLNGNNIGVVATPVLNMNGGSIAGTLKLTTNSVANINGGSIGALETYDNPLIQLHGGSIGSPIRLLDTSFMNIYGGGLLITGTAPWSQTIDGNVRSGTAYTVVGFLQNNGNTLSSFLIYDQDSGYTDNSLNPAQQFALIDTGGNFPITVDGKIIYLTASLNVGSSLSGYDLVIGRAPDGAYGAAGDINRGTTDADKYTVTIGPGATLNGNIDLGDGYDGVEVYNKNTALITGGTLGRLAVHDNAQVKMSGGSVNFWNILDQSTVSISGGSVTNIFPGYSSTTDISGGAITNLITYEHNTTTVRGTANITKATVGDSSFGIENAVPVLNQSGGSIGTLVVENRGTVNISDGAINGATVGESTFASVDGTAILNQTGGNIGTITAKNYGTVNQSGGTTGTLTTQGHSTANLSGGNVGGLNGNLFTGISAQDFSVVNISGGTISYMESQGSATVNITGGTLGGPSRGMGVIENSTLNLSGGRVYFVRTFANVGSIAHVNITGGEIVGGIGNNGTPYGIEALSNSKVDISGGSVPYVLADSNSQVAVGGTANVTRLDTQGTTNTTVNGGTVGSLNASGDSNIRVTGGNVANLFAGSLSGTVLINVSGGHVSTLTATTGQRLSISGTADITTAYMGGKTISTISSNAHLGQLTAAGQALVTMTGGNITTFITRNSSVTSMYGGHIDTLYRYDQSVFNLYGGSIGNNTIYALGDTITNLFADSYSFGDPLAANYLDTETGITYSGFFHSLNATFSDGTLLSTRYFEALSDSTGTSYHPQFSFSATGNAAAAPEAASGLLFLVGGVGSGLGLQKRRSRQTRGV